MYKHWRGLFYPEGLPVKRWFAWYADTFDTVEINNSFYRLPKPETFTAWRDQAPPGFCYAIKANRFITQAKKLVDCEEPMERMMTAARHLGDRLGPGDEIVLVASSGLHANGASLARMIAGRLPGGYDMVWMSQWSRAIWGQRPRPALTRTSRYRTAFRRAP